jgi:Flp pilus assembly pilin Flp
MYLFLTLRTFIESRIHARDEQGIVAVEYIFMAIGIVAAVAAGAAALGVKIDARLTGILP